MSTNCFDDNFVCMKKVRTRKRDIYFFFVTNKFSFVILFQHLLVLFKKKTLAFLKSFAAHIFNIMTKKEKDWTGIFFKIYVH